MTLAPATRSLFTNWTSCGWAQVARGAVQAVAHGTFQGGMMAISGGKFWNGFAAGAASSIASSLFSADLNTRNDATLGWGNSVRSSGAGMIAFGTVSGGAGAALTGGNFWQGAVTGLVVSGLNHAMHKMNGPSDPPKKDYKKFFRRMLSSINSDLPTVDGNISAMDHYYSGNSRPAQLGPNTIKALLNSKDYTRIQTRLVTGQAQVLNFTARVDLTFDGAFFVGRTPLTYSTSCNSSTCITSFSAFGGDSFSDPLDLGFEPSMAGPGGAAVAQPYNFIPVRFSIQYANPGYPVNR